MTPTKRQVAWFVIGAALAAAVLVVIFAVLTSATKSTQIRRLCCCRDVAVPGIYPAALSIRLPKELGRGHA